MFITKNQNNFAINPVLKYTHTPTICIDPSDSADSEARTATCLAPQRLLDPTSGKSTTKMYQSWGIWLSLHDSKK